MADNPNKKGGFYILVGGLVLAMTVVVVMATANTPLFANKPIDIKIAIPATPGEK